MNKNIYRQMDSRWGSLPYPTRYYSFGGNGCGCCACLHVLIEQDKYKNWTPKNLRPYMVNKGFATYGNGTTWSGITKTLEHYNNTVINHSSMDSLFKTLNERKKKGLPLLGVILFRSGSRGGVTWTAGGHYVAYVNYKKSNGKHYFYIKDSGGRCNDGWFCYETTMKGLIPQIWSALPKGAKATKITKTTTTTTTTKTTTTVATQSYSGKFPNTTLEYGDKGTQVQYLQKFLNWYGDYGLTVDGQFGSKTLSAVKSFQKKKGLTVDGIVGIKTINKMQGVKKKITNEQKPTTSTSTKVKVKGMDISVWQGKLDKTNFEKAKASGIKFVILRVGYTGSGSKKPTEDSVFEHNYKNAIAAGLPVGIYYYSLATNNTMAKEEADFVIKKLKGKKITYPVYIDMEDPNYQSKCSMGTLASVCNTFCKAIAAAGYEPGVYASLSWFNNKIGSISASHTKWVAQYNKTCDYKGAYDMWQYSSSEKVNGIGNKIDVNWCYKNFNNTTTPTPTTTTPTQATTQTTTSSDIVSKMNAWAIKTAKQTPQYHYNRWKESDLKTHTCPICKGRKYDDHYGWNCIGWAFAIWHHGGGIKCKCNCHVVADAKRILNAKTDKAAYDEAVKRVGIEDIKVIRNGGKSIKNMLKPGDICWTMSNGKIQHTYYYMGNGRYSDSTSGRSDNIKADMKISSSLLNKTVLAIRYTGK